MSYNFVQQLSVCVATNMVELQYEYLQDGDLQF